MSFFKTKQRASDRWWTKYIRLRDDNICQWCLKECTNPRNSGVSHYHERRKENTRFDDENCDLMHNIPCHVEAEHEKKIKGFKGATENGKYTNLKLNQLGQEKFDLLLMRSETYKKRDDVSDSLIIRNLIKKF